ncbi:MAG: hypothetical protein QOI31_2457 [Solirubrobacterales bacterium]|nr:hypothetical protein [Solirubrobacterales bacterium]
MAGRPHTRSLAPLALLAAALLCAFALFGGAGEAAQAAKCPKADAAPGDATSDELGEAVLCLIGKERRKADVKKLEQVWSLTKVAEKHTDVMIEENCLDHRCEGEKSLQDRIVNSGYPIPGGRYGFGEVTGCSLTPQAMVDAWMASRVHRKRLLGKAYRDVGIGAAKGKPDVPGCNDGSPRGVYTVIFGWRKG